MGEYTDVYYAWVLADKYAKYDEASFILYANEVFRFFWHIDVNYYYDLDTSLMYASKGGVTIDWCMRVGTRTKELYYNSLTRLHKEIKKNVESKNQYNASNE